MSHANSGLIQCLYNPLARQYSEYYQAIVILLDANWMMVSVLFLKIHTILAMRSLRRTQGDVITTSTPQLSSNFYLCVLSFSLHARPTNAHILLSYVLYRWR